MSDAVAGMKECSDLLVVFLVKIGRQAFDLGIFHLIALEGIGNAVL